MEEKFTIAEIKNYLNSFNVSDNLSMLSSIQFLTSENIKKANEPKDPSAETYRREVRFPDTEEMHCPECKRATPHILSPDRNLSFIPREYDAKLYKWSCALCTHQL